MIPVLTQPPGTPRVTVLIPSYNSDSTLRQCLRSVLMQTFSEMVVVVGDNASTDGSPAVVSECGDPRVRLVRRPRNLG